MCKTKTLCVRIEKSLYDKIAKSSVGVSGFVRESVIQSLEGKNQQGKSNPRIKRKDHVIQTMQEQINQMKAMQDHLNDEVLYLRELHQSTMSRVLQLPHSTAYDRDPIQDMQNTGDEETHHHQHTGILTKISSVITNYKTSK